MSKKLSISATIIIAALAGAVCFSAAYVIATKSMSSKVMALSERQAMYSKLSEVDNAVRANYDGIIDEDKLIEAICDGYIKGIDSQDVMYVTAETLAKEGYDQKEGYKVVKLSDGSAVVIKLNAKNASGDQK